MAENVAVSFDRDVVLSLNKKAAVAGKELCNCKSFLTETVKASLFAVLEALISQAQQLRG